MKSKRASADMTALGTLAGWLAIATIVGCLLALQGCDLP